MNKYILLEGKKIWYDNIRKMDDEELWSFLDDVRQEGYSNGYDQGYEYGFEAGEELYSD